MKKTIESPPKPELTPEERAAIAEYFRLRVRQAEIKAQLAELEDTVLTALKKMGTQKRTRGGKLYQISILPSSNWSYREAINARIARIREAARAAGMAFYSSTLSIRFSEAAKPKAKRKS